MGDHDHGAIGTAQRVDAIRDDSQRVDIEARVRFVEDRKAWLENRHLENLVAFLLPAGEALVDGPIEKLFIHVDEGQFLADQLEEIDRVEFIVIPVVPADGVERRFHEIRIGHAGNFHRVLKSQEDARAGALLGGEIGQRLAIEVDMSLRHRDLGEPGEDVGEGALAGSVRPHHRMNLTGIYDEVDALENLGISCPSMQVRNLEHGVHFGHQPTLPSRLRPSRF